jgi:integrase
VSVYDRWHLSHPPAGAKRCSQHRKVPSTAHGTGLRWQVRGTDQNGRPVKQNYEFEGDAKAREAELKADVRAGRYVDERAGKVTLRSRCELWRSIRDHDPLTAERVEISFRNHVYEDPAAPGRTPRGGAAIGEQPIGLLSRQPSTVQGWLTALRLHVNSKILLYELLSSVFDAAVADKIIAENPFKTDAVTKPRRTTRDVTAWPAGRIEEVAGGLPSRWRALPLLAAACGHRQGEAFAVAKTDLDFLRRTCRIDVQVKLVGGTLVFAPLKNDNALTVPVALPVVGALAAHIAACPPVSVTLPWEKPDGRPVTRELLFTRRDGLPLTRSSFNPRWRAAWRAAGVGEAEQVNGFHICRHSCAAAWLSNGLNIAKVAAYLGDSVAVVSRSYAHFLPDDDDRARVIMDRHFAGLAGGAGAPILTSEAAK